MADKWDILGTRDIKEVHKLLKSQFGVEERLPHAFLKSSKDKLYIITRDMGKIDWQNLRVNSAGLYFGRLQNGNIRLSIEGSQLIGPISKKNILDLDKENGLDWMRGKDLEIDTELDGWVLVRNGTDFMGCGRIKEGKLLNYVPKGRYLPEDIPE